MSFTKKFILVLFVIIISSSLLVANNSPKVEFLNNANGWLVTRGVTNGAITQNTKGDFQNFPVLRKFLPFYFNAGGNISLIKYSPWEINFNFEARSYLGRISANYSENSYCPFYQSFLIGTTLSREINPDLSLVIGFKRMFLHTFDNDTPSGWAKIDYGLKSKNIYKEVDIFLTGIVSHYFRTDRNINWDQGFYVKGKIIYKTPKNFDLLTSFKSDIISRKPLAIYEFTSFQDYQLKAGFLINERKYFLGVVSRFCDVSIPGEDTKFNIGFEFNWFF